MSETWQSSRPVHSDYGRLSRSTGQQKKAPTSTLLSHSGHRCHLPSTTTALRGSWERQPGIFFPASSHGWLMALSEQRLWLHTFCTALNAIQKATAPGALSGLSSSGHESVHPLCSAACYTGQKRLLSWFLQLMNLCLDMHFEHRANKRKINLVKEISVLQPHVFSPTNGRSNSPDQRPFLTSTMSSSLAIF